MSKIYAYVDETGKGIGYAHFIVSVVIVEQDQRSQVQDQLRNIEKASRRNRRKWAHSRPEFNTHYFEAVVETSQLYALSFCSVGGKLSNEVKQTSEAISQAIKKGGYSNRKAIILIDGELDRRVLRKYANKLRSLGIKVHKVKAIRKAVDDPISRYADSCCGLVRNNQEGKQQALYNKVVKAGMITIVTST